MALLLYLDQNYLSGIVKGEGAFRELEPALRAAVSRRAVASRSRKRIDSSQARGQTCRCSSCCASSPPASGFLTGAARS
jgi:hypothetical protein